jgi:hypothetical protein
LSLHLRVWLAVIGWIVAVTLVHLGLNTHALDFQASAHSHEEEFRVGFLPVT